MTATFAPPPAGGPFDPMPVVFLILSLALVSTTALAFG